MDDATRQALGLPSVNKPQNKLDLSACLKDRYHHKLTFQQIADKYGVCISAVHQRLSNFVDKLGDPDELRSFQDMEADIQSAVKRRISSELLKVDLSKTSPKDLATTYGIMFDKHRLQTGQATSQVSVFFHCVAESDQATVDNPVDNPVDNSSTIEDAQIIE